MLASCSPESANPMGLLIEGEERIVFINATYARWLGYEEPAQLIGCGVETVVTPNEAERMLGYGAQRARGHWAPPAYDFDAQHRSGRRLAARLTRAVCEESHGRKLISSWVIPRPVDEDAEHREFEAMVMEHGAMLRAVLMRKLRDVAEAEDAFQEILLYAWNHRHDFDPGRGSRGSWLVTMAKSRAVDRLRSRSRRARLLESAKIASPATPPPPDPSLLHERNRLRALLPTLPPPQREAIVLSYFEGHSQSEIAKKLRIPLGTVKSRMNLGLRRLRAGLC